jgi:23S rRNA pseudouridine2605 synthase
VTSRRHAEKLISSGMIKVDGKTVKQNVPVNDLSNIQVFSTSGYQTPIKESTRIWLFYKPVGITCSLNDPIGRISVYKYLEANKFCYKHFSIAGKLDAGSEGLLILTNNSDMAAAIEHNDTIERVR